MDYKMGDTVYFEGVEGKVLNIEHEGDYPVIVSFQDQEIKSFTWQGVYVMGHPERLHSTKPSWIGTDCAEKPIKAETSTGVKKDDNKLRMDLLSPIALKKLSEVLTAGSVKYSAHNWRGGIAWSRVIAATLRHFTCFLEGEDIDSESGLRHIDHVACNVMFLSEYMDTHPELDDRYKTKK